MDVPPQAWWPSHHDDDPADQTLWQLHVTIGRGRRRGRLVFSMPVFDEDAGGARTERIGGFESR